MWKNFPLLEKNLDKGKIPLYNSIYIKQEKKKSTEFGLFQRASFGGRSKERTWEDGLFIGAVEVFRRLRVLPLQG